MPEKAISRFSVLGRAEIPDDIRERIDAVRDKAGFVPNVFLALARRPEEFRAFFAFHDALMDKRDGLTPGEREMIVVVTSSLNQCLYCVVSHSAILRLRERNAILADQLAINYREADISARQRVMLDFACRLALEPAQVGEADFEGLRAVGFDDEEIWDIGAITSLFAMSNRMASLTAMRPNDEFYEMGRVPKA